MTQVFYCSTFFGAVTLAAAIDAGCFGDHGERRILIVSTNTAIPEIATAVDSAPGFETLRDRFDGIFSWNDIIAPLHPADWTPRPLETPLLARMTAMRLGLVDAPTELVVESVAVAPARAIAALIRDCPITVFSDGLMSYGPTRLRLAPDVAGRTSRLLYLDLEPPLEPLLLREHEVRCEPIPDDAFLRVLAGLPAPVGIEEWTGCSMILGQYLSALDILTRAEESALDADILRALVARGHRRVVFKPHPAAGRGRVRELRAEAARLGVQVRVVGDGGPAEVWFGRARPELVVSCFSTALLTARRYFGIPVATVGCETVLERLTPYQNSNRIPATIVDATVPRLLADGTICTPPPVGLGLLVAAVGYCMQPATRPDLHEAAATYLAAHGRSRYFKARRLEAVGLLTPPLRRSPRVLRTSAVARRGVVRMRQSGVDLRRRLT